VGKVVKEKPQAKNEALTQKSETIQRVIGNELGDKRYE
jgi:hypothetical protein